MRRTFSRNDAGGELIVRGMWNETELLLLFEGLRRFKVHAKIDASAPNGFWEGGDTYLLRISEAQTEFAGLGLSGAIDTATVRDFGFREDQWMSQPSWVQHNPVRALIEASLTLPGNCRRHRTFEPCPGSHDRTQITRALRAASLDFGELGRFAVEV